VSFALTTLDSATRLLRFNISEIGAALGVRALENRFVATALAVGAICWFAFYKIDGRPAGLALWQLFGITNQLLAGLTLLVVTLYLHQRGRSVLFTGLPMLFMLASTLTAMVRKIKGFSDQGEHLLFGMGLILLVIGVWIIVEGILAFRRRTRYESDLITFSGPGGGS
jgi:carbon starvation protein